MIREWLAHARAERVAARAARGERAWRRDLQQHPDELLAFRDAQIEGLRERNRELELQLAAVRATLAPYLAQEWKKHGVRLARRLAEEPTVQARPMGRVSGWQSTPTEQRGGTPTERRPR